jgi:hypothetical protein
MAFPTETRQVIEAINSGYDPQALMRVLEGKPELQAIVQAERAPGLLDALRLAEADPLSSREGRERVRTPLLNTSPDVPPVSPSPEEPATGYLGEVKRLYGLAEDLFKSGNVYGYGNKDTAGSALSDNIMSRLDPKKDDSSLEPTAPKLEDEASQQIVDTIDAANAEKRQNPAKGDTTNYDKAKREALEKGQPLTPEAATAATTQDSIIQVEQDMKDQGLWNKESKSAWENFNDQYDLTTFGLNMMALSGSGRSVTQSMGIALSAARGAKKAQIDAGIASATAARKENREERELRVEEAKALGDISRKEAQTAVDLAKLPIEQQKADAYMMKASAAMKKAVAEGREVELIDNKQAIEATTAWLTHRGVNEVSANAQARQFATDVAELHSRGGRSMAEAQQQMLDTYINAGLINPQTGISSLFTSGEYE